jgi:hypothetical protein
MLKRYRFDSKRPAQQRTIALKRRLGLLLRSGVTLIASLVVTALVAPGAGAH